MKRQSGAGTMASLTLAMVFGVTLLLSLVTGAGVFRRVEDRVEQSAQQRVGLTYLVAKIHGYDALGGVRAVQFGDGDAVCLSEELNGVSYQTYLYVSDGWLREQMSPEGGVAAPEAGQAIAQADSLQVERSGGLLRLRLSMAGESRTADVFLRAEGE